MRKIAMTAAGIAAAVIGTGVALAPTANAAANGTAASCPSGAVCLQEPNGSILSKNIWYSYGAHNLQNVTGYKVLINNQTGGAGFQICKGYNGTNCYVVLRGTGAYASYDFTPINSIVLVR
ncbi:hypothetical protein [Kribbella solani]|uniref:Peptidase inhibitor family I36 n=1 Tax=Kribbella solani TaxID=236067 RepID=A0A841E4M8_9ACTN|nr:hypothetical protein [Kribbella solani]MBB5983935.1 hypothetical protein [Kribbella solani]MDX2973882.1 hypothetical protein [Kribbella solani]MDX3006498.1 hypothetical protein [Kribbella solani]